MGKVFAVTSGKGGVGKSTVSVGLSFAMLKMKKRVALVDMDLGLRCLDLMLGIQSKIVFDLADAIELDDASKSVYRVDGYEGLFLIPAPAKSQQLDLKAFSAFAQRLSQEYDAVIFDFAAGIDIELYSTLPENTQFITVSTPDPICVRDAWAINTALCEKSLSTRLIINQFDRKLMRKGLYHNIDDMIDLSGIQLLGIVPMSKDLSLLSIKHKLKKNSKAARAFSRIAARLFGKKLPLPKFKKI